MHHLTRRRALAAGASLAALPFAATSSQAQAAWKPDRPVALYNPFAAGGSTDVHMRFLADRATRTLGQQVIVDPKPGAAGTLAAAALLPLKADGHAIACMSINSLRYPHYQETNWHPLRDFTYIIGVSTYTIGIVVRADSPWKTIDDMIAAGKKEPEKFNYGTSGIGGTGHLLMLELEAATGAKFMHIPYKGGAEWMAALMGGHIQLIPDAAQWAPFVDAGQVRVLAMATEKRFPKYPDAPTLVERGINVVAQSPYGLVGPRAMPDAVVKGLHDAFKAAMDDPAHQGLLDKVIQPTWYKSPAEYRAFAEKYFVDIKPTLIKAGLAKG